MTEIRIYVANLAAYNNGELKGEWFDLPVEWEDIVYTIFDKHELDEYGNPLGDYAIHDYEAPFQIEEYSSIKKLNEIAEVFDSLSKKQIEIVVELNREGIISCCSEGKEALEHVVVYEQCSNMGDVAHHRLHDQYDHREYPLFFRHLNYESYGEEIESNGTFIHLEDSIIEYLN